MMQTPNIAFKSSNVFQTTINWIPLIIYDKINRQQTNEQKRRTHFFLASIPFEDLVRGRDAPHVVVLAHSHLRQLARHRDELAVVDGPAHDLVPLRDAPARAVLAHRHRSEHCVLAQLGPVDAGPPIGGAGVVQRPDGRFAADRHGRCFELCFAHETFPLHVVARVHFALARHGPQRAVCCHRQLLHFAAHLHPTFFNQMIRLITIQ